MNYKFELSKLLTNSIITDEQGAVEHANTATFATLTGSRLLVFARDVQDIQQLLTFCSEKTIKLHVVSNGRNWGFGSKVPVSDVEILLNLSLMNRIINYDEVFGTVRVEPGVSFKQLSEFLKDKGDRHFLNTIGGDPNASVLGNIMERGDGAGPYCERSEYACSTEVVHAGGEIVETGFGNINNSKVADLCTSGIGPDFTEIFFQSNFAIVTKITLWLCPVPKNFRSFNFGLGEVHSLSAALNKLRSLYVKRVLTTPVTFLNDYKQMANTLQLPWELKTGRALDRSALKQVSNNYSTWYAFGGVYVDQPVISKQIVREIFKTLGKSVKRRSVFSHLSTSKIKYLRVLNAVSKKTRLDFSALIGSWENNQLLGQINPAATRSLFWRKQQPVPKMIDPAMQQCGLHWNSFIMPFDGEIIEKTLTEIDTIILHHGFEPVISFITLNDRYIKVFQQLLFDRENEEEDRQASACHQDVFDYLETAGFSHYRADVRNMNDKSPFKNDLIHQKIKQALDPEGIISPGRYWIW
jgi:4-cresol dehydrogenase (hydroxylating)